MNSLTVPKRGSAAQALAALNAEDAPSNPSEMDGEMDVVQPPVQPPVHTDSRTAVHTAVREDGSTEAQPPVLTAVRADGRTAVREDGGTAVRKATRPSARPAARADDGDSFADKVKAQIDRREPLEGGTKATLEYSLDLSRRVKQYCLDKGKHMTLRVLLTVLLTTFLEEEGY